MREFTEQEQVRREKLDKIRNMGIDPFGKSYPVSAFSMDIKAKYQDKTHEELEES